ncbi:cytochrome b/b6 domain-containing protein [Tsuneonella sp. HG249]
MWDLPVRAVHWSLVLALPALWWTGENHEMDWHMRIGLVVLALVVFRILWGFAGSSTARFGNFVRGPGQVLAYLKGKTRHSGVGHNPVGGYSALLLLGLLALQVALGLFSGDEDDGVTGPLNQRVSYAAGDFATEAHEVLFYAVLAAVAVHIAAILFYLFVKRNNLVSPMLTGRSKALVSEAGLTTVAGWRAAACAVIALTFAWWIWSGAPLG